MDFNFDIEAQQEVRSCTLLPPNRKEILSFEGFISYINTFPGSSESRWWIYRQATAERLKKCLMKGYDSD